MQEVQNFQDFSMRKTIISLTAIVAGMFMVILDSTVVNVALRNMTVEMNSDLSTMQWTITGYTLALAAVIPLAGWLIDRFGAKRMFLITISLFTLGSLLCSLATTPEQLITFRILQGVGGGMVMPIGMAIVFRIAPPNKMGAVMSTLGVPMLLGPAIGPVVAGYFVEYLTWHWIFLINVPVGIIAVILGVKFLPSLERKSVPSLDILGMILAPIAFGMLAYGVSESVNGWADKTTLTGIIVGGIALILFVIVELRREHPLLELKSFKSLGFTLGSFTVWAMQIALFGMFLIVPLFLQNVKQFSPVETGWTIFPQAIAAAIIMPIGGRLYDRVGARPLGVVGIGLITSSMLLFSRITVSSSEAFIVMCLIIMGAGMGMSMMAMNTHILQSAPRGLVNRVTPLTTSAQQVMVSFATAGMASFLTTKITEHATEAKIPADAMAAIAQGNIAPALPFLDKINTATVSGFSDTFLLSAGIAFVGWIIVWTLKKPQKVESDLDEHEVQAMNMGH